MALHFKIHETTKDHLPPESLREGSQGEGNSRESRSSKRDIENSDDILGVCQSNLLD